MLCPKCKKEIADNSLKCSYCGTKIGSVCKICGSYNLITSVKCSNCGQILLKICENCGSANLPNVKICRKCGKNLPDNENERVKNSKPVYVASANSQQKVKDTLVEYITDDNPIVITLSGESGLGKNVVLNNVINELQNANILWLRGTCSHVSQLSPLGYFQDVLLSFFNINNFCQNTMQLRKNSVKFFKHDFPTLTNSEIIDLLNILYPEDTDKYENIYFNKMKTFCILKKVFTTILEKVKAVFIVDNADFIDGMSYDFIKELLNDDFLITRCKFVIMSTQSRPGMGFLNVQNLSEENYSDLSLAPFTEQQVTNFVKQINGRADKQIADISAKIAKGNPAVIEQILFLNKELEKKGTADISDFKNINMIIEERLKILKSENKQAYRFLVAMSVLGQKFYPAMLESFDKINQKEYEKVLKVLVEKGYITQTNNLCFEFKFYTLWKITVAIVKNDTAFEEILNILYEILSSYNQSSVALLGFIVQKLNNNDTSFEIWTLLMKHASYIGDIGLYIITQQQALKLIENKANDFYAKVRKNIYARLGKIMEPIDATASFDYLQKAIMVLEDTEECKHIELLGYLASCAMKMGNYCGVLECIDNVLNKMPETQSFEKILVKSRQLRPFLKLGNYGQLINLTEIEILPVFEKILKRGQDVASIKINKLYQTWLETYFDYAEASVFQGECNKAFEIIDTIYEIIDKNKEKNESIACRINLLLALANTIKGDIETSNSILSDIIKEYSLDGIDEYLVSKWNFINILNKFFIKDYKNIYNELFNAVMYANNVNDLFTKNILKVLLAKILKDNGQTKKALEILEEQVAYFAKEKVSTGVLLSWYLLSEIKLITNGIQFTLDIATKSLDIASGSSINNYYFIALFNKLIGETYLAKQDFESARVYLEKAIFIAEKFNLQYILVKTYIMCSRMYQELAMPKTTKRELYVSKALEMIQVAKNVSIVKGQPELQKNLKESLNILTSFCKINKIELPKNN